MQEISVIIITNEILKKKRNTSKSQRQYCRACKLSKIACEIGSDFGGNNSFSFMCENWTINAVHHLKDSNALLPITGKKHLL